MKKSKKKL